MKKTSLIRKAIHGRLTVPFKRALTMSKPAPASDLRVPKKRLSDTVLTHDDLHKINELSLRIERQKAYGIQMILERQRCR